MPHNGTPSLQTLWGLHGEIIGDYCQFLWEPEFGYCQLWAIGSTE